jgi:hypothetical protein
LTYSNNLAILNKMNAFKVKLSDGDTEWWETIKARNLDHLYDIIDSEGYDVVETQLEN